MDTIRIIETNERTGAQREYVIERDVDEEAQLDKAFRALMEYDPSNDPDDDQ